MERIHMLVIVLTAFLVLVVKKNVR